MHKSAFYQISEVSSEFENQSVMPNSEKDSIYALSINLKQKQYLNFQEALGLQEILFRSQRNELSPEMKLETELV